MNCQILEANDLAKIRIINACIGESEEEPYIGKLAVVCAIINRVNKFGNLDKALNGVYGENSYRVKNRLYSSRVLVDSVRAYEESLHSENCEFIDGADHWEGTKFKKPTWSFNMTETARIGNHIFYRSK